MKKYILLILVFLAGCATQPLSESEKWRKIKDLTGEPLVQALIELHDMSIAEFNEEIRNVRLEIEALKKTNDSSQKSKLQLAVKESTEEVLKSRLYQSAIEEKMRIWKQIQTK